MMLQLICSYFLWFNIHLPLKLSHFMSFKYNYLFSFLLGNNFTRIIKTELIINLRSIFISNKSFIYSDRISSPFIKK